MILGLGGYLGFNQFLFLIDPGLRDVHIREAIQDLTEKDCVVIVAGCQQLYRTNIDRLSDRGLAKSDEIPAPAARVGYQMATIRRDSVRFVAGAGGFSQVGPITIVCNIDPATMMAIDLVLDDGRRFDPTSGGFAPR